MKLAEKIAVLRRAAQMTQEELAAQCCVSRQSVSKWEADLALPDMDNLLALGSIFNISMDVLLKEELTVSGVKEMHTCGANAVQQKRLALYEGILIKESVADESVIDLLNIHKVELWHTGGKPRYWTALFFSSEAPDLPQRFAQAMLPGQDDGGNWFVDFKAGNVKYIVFHGRILHYRIGAAEEKAAVCDACQSLGIDDSQMHWPE